MKIYEFKRDLHCYIDYYGADMGDATIRSGTRFKVVREPVPRKKKYKLVEISEKFEPRNLYLRKSEFNKLVREEDLVFIKEIDEPMEE